MDSLDNTRTPIPAPTLLGATIVGTAASSTDTLMVMIDAFGDQPFGDPEGVVWTPHVGPVYPQDGDMAWVMEADDGTWVVVAWKPS